MESLKSVILICHSWFQNDYTLIPKALKHVCLSPCLCHVYSLAFLCIFFFLISNKEVYSENYLMKTEAEQTIQREKQTEKRTRKQAETTKN